MVKTTTDKKRTTQKKTTARKKTSRPAVPKVSRTLKPDDMELEEWQRLLRKQYGEQQPFRLENVGDHPLFSDFRLTNPLSGKTYRIAIRGEREGENFCSCPDYRINNLGTCKHIEFTLAALRKKRGAKKQFKAGYVPPYSEVYLAYGLRREVRFRAGQNAPARLLTQARHYFGDDGVLKERHLLDLHTFLNAFPADDGHELRCYDDVMAFIASHQDAAHRRSMIESRMPEESASPLLDTILKTSLHPYQREGALFALRAGRCLIGDDMGLGKTIQALAASELMAELFGVRKVLIVSPTSLKYQWQGEIERFTSRTGQVVEGLVSRRKELYRSDSFFKMINYELVHRDAELIREWGPDLIILDEAQRIKNWQTRTAKSVKNLESTFAIVLTGTPIENRIEELHSIMEFVDCHHLGPLYRFVHEHRLTDEAGKVVGYRNLESVRKSLKGVMIRRRKKEVLSQLPERVDKNFFVALTPEQALIHEEFAEIVARLVAKWRRYRFLSEADNLRLRIALSNMRMVSDNTWLVDKKTKHGPKLEELETLLREMVIEGGEKVVIFSQWLRMNGLVEELLTANGIGYVHLNGGVPSKERKGLMTRFKDDPDCKVFLSTDAGGVGLNLQSGSVVINMDIPWNPAVLEQRIGRVHRMGQKRSVRVVNFISKDSIEERILDLLRFKKSLFAGALDGEGGDVVMVGPSQLERFMESVEEATGNLPRRDSEVERQERLEEAREKDAEEAESVLEEQGVRVDAVIPAGQGNAVLNDLLQSGAQFLMNLSRAVSSPATAGDTSGGGGESIGNAVGSLVERDEATGKSCLKIPLPAPEVVSQLVSGLGQLLAGIFPQIPKG
jgi:superfamily II DNA or RNA helicase